MRGQETVAQLVISPGFGFIERIEYFLFGGGSTTGTPKAFGAGCLSILDAIAAKTTPNG